MTIEYNYIILSAIKTLEIKKGIILARLYFSDDSCCKTSNNDISMRTEEEFRRIKRLCELKVKANIVINAYDRHIIKIDSIDEAKTIYCL